MRNVSALAAGAALALSLSACSTVSKPTPMAPAAPAAPVIGKMAESTVTATATVEKIDLKSRHVTLRGADGKSITVKVPDEVRNLPQVKVGDVVVLTYYESAAFEVKKAGTATPGVVAVADAGRAKAGEMPGAVAASAVTVTVTIAAIDKATPSVTLKGPDGDLTVVKVKDPSKLDQVQVGDLVEITYTEALAVSVEPKQK